MYQSLESKKGEINFRKKLVQQQVFSENNLTDEFDQEGIEKILNQRMKKTLSQFEIFKKQNLICAPFLEIGAERCQRSLILENDLEIKGGCVDISYDMLKSCNYYGRVFNKCKIPTRICCDINNLPFLTGSVPFIFCYQTLHHFPDPGLITREIHRVMSPGGYFFFDEESYKKILHLNLYKSKKMYSKEALNVGKIRKTFDYFFASANCNETEYGIIENDNISIECWKNALKYFKEKDISLRSAGLIKSELFNPRSKLKSVLTYLLGGNISGICQKEGALAGNFTALLENIICPECMEKGIEKKLINIQRYFQCPNCNNQFPVIDEIIFLFSNEKFKQLYPEFSRMNTNKP